MNAMKGSEPPTTIAPNTLIIGKRLSISNANAQSDK
jgi:hypothetical protein